MVFKYLASIFKNSGKCKQKVFNGIKKSEKQQEYLVAYTGVSIFH